MLNHHEDWDYLNNIKPYDNPTDNLLNCKLEESLNFLNSKHNLFQSRLTLQPYLNKQIYFSPTPPSTHTPDNPAIITTPQGTYYLEQHLIPPNLPPTHILPAKVTVSAPKANHHTPTYTYYHQGLYLSVINTLAPPTPPTPSPHPQLTANSNDYFIFASEQSAMAYKLYKQLISNNINCEYISNPTNTTILLNQPTKTELNMARAIINSQTVPPPSNHSNHYNKPNNPSTILADDTTILADDDYV